jgi:hypothetical protein
VIDKRELEKSCCPSKKLCTEKNNRHTTSKLNSTSVYKKLNINNFY